MKTPIKDFDDLASRAGQFLLQWLSYTEKTVVGYKSHFRQIKKLMLKNNITHFDKDNVSLILRLKFGVRTYPSLSDHEKDFISAVNKLQEFQLNGSIVLSVPPKKAPLIFDGSIGEVINSFLEYKTYKARLSKIRLNCYRRSLFSFQTFCGKKQVTSFKGVYKLDRCNQIVSDIYYHLYFSWFHAICV